MTTLENRRPLKVREREWAKRCARWLSRRAITPNQISIGSVVCALLAALSLLALREGYLLAAWAAALFIQCRLLCNLFDGMVAVEGGKSTPAGELFNDIPDRLADPLILVAAGYAVAVVSWGADLGWLAALLAVLTAYVRTLASASGAPTRFTGPMAKQQRMAVMTLAALLTPLESFFNGTTGYALLLALLLIAVGSAVTAARRTRDAFHYLTTSAMPSASDD
ncbi:MAG: CDP-alcohol phosphatidyltransferase family protein [Pseudomonadales bacterium]|jgi:phosphatidylglycerophosphate synthase|nr:CDP-alcohol phosphatidyltransferase family protein [Pseudomonadales bacterium]